MLLSDESLEALMRRRAAAIVNANEGVVKDLIAICLRSEINRDMQNALDLLRDSAVTATTLGNDIDTLLAERAHLLRLLSVYKKLEQFVGEPSTEGED